MKLTEQIIVEEMAKVGYGGTQAQQAAARIMERAQLSPVEQANIVDRTVLQVHAHPGGAIGRREHVEAVITNLVKELG